MFSIYTVHCEKSCVRVSLYYQKRFLNACSSGTDMPRGKNKKSLALFLCSPYISPSITYDLKIPQIHIGLGDFSTHALCPQTRSNS